VTILRNKIQCVYENNINGKFENWVLRRIFGPKRDEVKRSAENFIMRGLMTCTPHPLLYGC
jgi:hypothetical protein